MKRIALVVLVACGKPAAPTAIEAGPHATVEDASYDDAAADASPPEPTACSEAGPPAWYLVAKGDKCNVTSTLEWLDDGRSPHLFVSTPPLLDALTWTAEMPDCFGANAVITKVTSVDDHTFRVAIDGHDNGGSGCHAWFTSHFEGTVVVDPYGAIVRADFTGTQTTAADDTPACRALVGTKRLQAHVHRACKAD